MKNYICLAENKFVKSILLILLVLIINSDSLYAQYCTSASSDCTTEYISRVQMNTGSVLDNSSGWTVYSNFTGLGPFDVYKGYEYNFTATIDGWQTYNTVYIDWNQNLDFSDAGESYYIGYGNGDVSGSIVVPAGATSGITRMRIVASNDVYTGPCTDTYNRGETEDYNLNIKIVASCTPPTTQASNFSATAITENSMTINWTRGNGNEVIVLAGEGSAVNADPINGVSYTANAAYGSGNEIGVGNFVVYKGPATSVDLTSLTQGATYHFAIYEYNTADDCYLTPPLTGSQKTVILYCDSEGHSSSIAYLTNVELLLFSDLSVIIDNPSGQSFYSNFCGLASEPHEVMVGDRYYFTGDYVGDPGEDEYIVIYCDWNQNGLFEDGTNEEYRVPKNTNYRNDIIIPTDALPGETGMRVILGNAWIMPCIANNSGYRGETEDYLLTVCTCAPRIQASDFSIIATDDDNMTLGWTRGDGDNVLVVARESSAVSGDPVDGTAYAADPNYGDGDALGGGFVVYNGPLTSVNVTGLLPLTNYHFAIYEYNNDEICYLIPRLTCEGITNCTDCTIWEGDESSDWGTGNNWTAGTPGSTITAIIPDVSAALGDFPVITSAAECNDLHIRTGANVQIAPDWSLTVSGDITNSAGIAGLVVKSDATGDGSLIHNTASIPATVERYFAGTQYHYISSPITAADVAGVGIINTQFYDWDATITWGGMGASPPETIDWDPWLVNYPITGAMDVAKGYAYFYQTQTLNYQGNINVGTYNINLDNAGGGEANDQGWNLLGNPYPCSLDWDAVASDYSTTDIEGAVYLFDDDGTGVNSNYRYYIPPNPATGGYGIGSNDATKEIPLGQGFFVKTATDNQNLTINPTHRIHSTQPFYKNDFENIIRMTINSEQSYDELIVRLLELASTDFDGTLDARKLIPSNPNIPQFYTITTDNINSAINSIPDNDEDIVLPIGIICIAGEYTFNITEQALVEGKRLFLIDNYLNTETQLFIGTEYTFNHTGGVNNDRFELVFKVNHAPFVANPIKDMETDADYLYNFTFAEDVFTDIDPGDILSYEASLNTGLLPSWLTFDSDQRTFTGLPTNDDAGVYNIMLTATDKEFESATDEFLLEVNKTTGTEEIFTNDLVICPNPNNGTFNINLQNLSEANVEIYNINGQAIYQVKSSNDILEVDLSSYSKGVYFVKITSGNEVYNGKIILK